MSQKTQVLKYLKTHRGITSIQAIEKFGATRLGAIIWDLRHKDGFEITDVWITKVYKDNSVKHFKEYRLEKGA